MGWLRWLWDWGGEDTPATEPSSSLSIEVSVVRSLGVTVSAERSIAIPVSAVTSIELEVSL